MKRLIITFFLLTGVAMGIRAAQFVPMSIEDMASKAELIVRGKVTGKTFGRDAGGRIYTRIRLEVAETWKGRASGTIEIVHSGGKFGGRTAITTGQVEYAPGEEVVAFLVLNSDSLAVTLGLAQGKFYVWKDPDSGQSMAKSLFHGNGQPGGSGLEAPKLLSPSATSADKTGNLTVAALKQWVLGGRK
jgi:hypothetical protein